MKRKPKHFIPNILTLFNMFLGFLAIGLIINNQPIKAGVFVLFSGMFDTFDGKIARLLGIESKFGIEFDSMADTVSFCVVPSVLIYSLYVDGLNPLLGGAIAFIPLMFGSIRLAKFNIDQEFGNKRSYTIGLTTPISTITLFSYLFFNHQIYNNYGDPRTALMLTVVLGYLMISPIHFAKFPLLSFKSGRSNSIMLVVFIFSFLGMITLKGLFLLPLTIIFISWNIIHWVIFQNKKSLSSKV
tara:strand:+ start:467 stop:1192 length:726 start_codon:yes stop_codon:yes gene_type:complete